MSADVEAVAKFLQSRYQIRPGQSWGRLKDLDLRAFWDRNNCNQFFPNTIAQKPRTDLPVHCYWGSWGGPILNADLARRGNVTFIFSFWNLTAACQITGRDAAAEAQIKAAGAAVLAGIGGWGAATPFASLFGNQKTRTAAIENLGQAIEDAKWQGLVIDWEYASTESEWISLVAFFQQYRQRWPQHTLAVALSSEVPQTSQIGPLSAAVDYLHIMTYDFVGAWVNKAGHNSSVQQGTQSLIAWEKAGADHKKLMLGCAWYGRSCSCAGMGAAASNWGELSYRDILPLESQGWNLKRDSDGTPWIENQGLQRLVTFEDSACVSIKRNWVQQGKWGGIFCWEWGQDSGDGQLARAMLGL